MAREIGPFLLLNSINYLWYSMYILYETYLGSESDRAAAQNCAGKGRAYDGQKDSRENILWL